MTDESSSISRRNVLAGLGTAGVGAAIVGAGTSALFSDGETLPDNQLVAGELSLVVDWQESYDMGNGYELIDVFPDVHDEGYQDTGDMYICDLVEEDPLASEHRSVRPFDSDAKEYGEFGDPDPNDPEPLVNLVDVKPGDCWETTFSYHLCDNDGWVWFRTDADFGQTEGDHLADRAWARVWYDVYQGKDEETIHAGDNEYQAGKEPIIAQGSLRDVLEELDGGVLLDADPLVKPHDGDENGSNGDCIHLGKVDRAPTQSDVADDDIGDELAGGADLPEDFWFDITGLHWKDEDENGEVVGFDWESNYGICTVSVKGGTDSEPNAYDCAFEGTAFAPFGAGPGGSKRHEISHFDVWYCEDVTEPPEQEDPACTPASTDHFIGFEWCLPAFDDDGMIDNNEIQGDELFFDFEFYAEQCRHNDDPANPWE